MDFFSAPTATFRAFQVLFIIRHGRREVVRCAVTTSPTAAWVAQQLREAFPFESAPRFMIFDRDERSNARTQNLPIDNSILVDSALITGAFARNMLENGKGFEAVSTTRTAFVFPA